MENGKRVLADDHARMKTAHGAERVVPFWQVLDWKNQGVLGIGEGRVGYDFASPKYAEAYAAWERAEAAKKNVGKVRASTFVRDGGMADAIQKVGEAAVSGTEPIIPTAPIPPDTRPVKPGEVLPSSPPSEGADVEVRDSL